jgi:K+-sensing histidine kinase KdpD
VLVDELAHTNAPDSLHPKRWQDVTELLFAGINVYSTLNIQHIESLNDVVARITGVRVRETVPDKILEQADEVELVDLTPSELIERLNQGKVYAPELADRALEKFFNLGNLAALRELALRRTADQVDDQVLGYMRAHGIEGPWPVNERILVCIGRDPASGLAVRAARRLADQMQADGGMRCRQVGPFALRLLHPILAEAGLAGLDKREDLFGGMRFGYGDQFDRLGRTARRVRGAAKFFTDRGQARGGSIGR